MERIRKARCKDMTNYEVIEMIMNSHLADKNYKALLIQSFLLHYMTQREIEAIIQKYQLRKG